MAPGAPTKGGGGKIKIYGVPGGKAAVTAETRVALKSWKWAIVKDEPSPSGNATRIQAKPTGSCGRLASPATKADRDHPDVLVD